MAQSAPAPRRIARLLAGISTGAAALALSLAPHAALAGTLDTGGAVNGTPTAQFGVGSITRTPTLDTVTVNAKDALIDWASSDPNVYLPVTHTLQFNGSTGAPYTVLNRVDAVGPLQVNGTVSADAAGHVWFYNPGGWVVGSTGAFNVGSLVLTSDPIAVTGTAIDGQRLVDANGAIHFTQGAAGAGVTVMPGGTITTTGAGSYVALVAPRVVQGGTVTNNGSTAYVGAEAATLKVNNGLFDITVDTGTTDANGVVHTGTTTGPAGTASDPVHRIYVAAVPKNQVLTMLVSGNLGYTAAATAQNQVDGTIVLSAGGNISAGVAATPTTGNASITLSNLAATDAATIVAANAITADATSSRVTFAKSLNASAQNAIAINAAGAGNGFSVGGDLTLAATTGTTGGAITLGASNGANFAVAGNLDASVDGQGTVIRDPQNGDQLLAGSVGASASAGTITATIANGAFAVGGFADLHAVAYGGIGAASAGTAQGGTVSFSQTGANGSTRIGTVDAPGDLTLDARGDTIAQLDSPPAFSTTGAAASAGAATLSVAGGNFAAGGIRIQSSANTAPAQDTTPFAATAGNASATFAGGSYTATGLLLFTNANDQNQGAVSTGKASLTLDNAALALGSGSFNVFSSSRGTAQPLGGAALVLRNGSTLSSTGFNSVSSQANDVANGVVKPGDLTVTLSNSTLTTGGLSLNSQAAAGPVGADATGGLVTLTLDAGSTINDDGSLFLGSFGVAGQAPNAALDGGLGTGGTVRLAITDSAVQVTGSVQVTAEGFAGQRGTATGRSGLGQGGTASLTLDGTRASLTGNDITVSAPGSQPIFGAVAPSGFGSGSGQVGGGAGGTGGTSTFTVSNGATVAAQTLTVSAIGTAGDGANVAGAPPAAGGTGTGGSATLTLDGSGGTINVPTIVLDSSGFGGFGADADFADAVAAGNGGIGRGGQSTVNLFGGQVTTTSLSVVSGGNQSQQGDGFAVTSGNGGIVGDQGVGTGGIGGAGFGGTSTLNLGGGNLLGTNANDFAVAVSAIGQGGPGGATFSGDGPPSTQGAGGVGTGGTAQLFLDANPPGSAHFTIDAPGLGGPGGVELSSSTIVANAGAGGAGQGGTATLEIGTDVDYGPNAEFPSSFTVGADGIGADGSKGIIGSAGGAGTGGFANVFLNGNVTLSGLSASASGTGGRGGDSLLGNDGAVGGAGSGGNAQVVSAFGGSATLDSFLVQATGTGGRGGTGGSGTASQAMAGNGGAGGTGSGGYVFAQADSGSTLTLVPSRTATLVIDATGGQGGNGGDAGQFGFALRGNGAKGGDAVGGSLQFLATGGGTLDLGDANYAIDATGGNGGEVVGGPGPVNPNPSLGGAGGRADFGEIRLAATDPRSTIHASSLNLAANAQGGTGGDGYGTDPNTGNGTPGANGGDATGARISLLADTGGTIAVDPGGAVSLLAEATGGNGGAGSAGLAGTGGAGGRGGNGGSGFDTAVAIQTGTNGSITFGGDVSSAIGANVFGGPGGNGGAGASNSAIGGDGGNGGDAGTNGAGNAGQVSLIANGGILTTGDLMLGANGTAYEGSLGGQGGTGGAGGPGRTIPNENGPPTIIPPGLPGANGGASSFSPVGGSIVLTAADDGSGQSGTLALGNVTASVTSQFVGDGFQDISLAGTIALTDTTNAPGAGIMAQSLTLDASGYSDANPTAITLLSVNHPITVVGSLTANADGNILFTGQNGGGVSASDTIELNSNNQINLNTINGGLFTASTVTLAAGGTIQLDAGGCLQACIVAHADGAFAAQASNQFVLSGGAQVEGLDSLSVTTGSDILGDHGSGYLSNGDVTLFGGSNVQVRNVRAGNALTVDAGASSDGEITFYNPATLTVGEDDGTGRISAGADQAFRSGGTISVPGGNILEAGHGLDFASAGDIVVGANASITANTGAFDTPGAITFNAGGIVPQTPLASGDIASLLIGSGATIAAGLGDITLTAAAIDARGAAFSGNAFTADVSGTLSLGTAQGNDGGQLAAPCLEGDICLGALGMTGAVLVGSGEATPLHVTALDPIAGSSVGIFAQGALTVGSAGQLATITAPGLVQLVSQQGDVTLTGGAMLTGGAVDIAAAGSLLGNGRIAATASDIGITVGGDIIASALSARQLTASGKTGDPLEPAFATPGAFTVGTLALTTDSVISAGGAITLGQANLGGHLLSLTAAGATSLMGTSGVTDLTLAGDSVNFGTIAATRSITARAANALTGTQAIAGTSFAGSGNPIAIGAIASGTDTTLNGGPMTLGTIGAGGNVQITSNGMVSLDRGSATGSLSITADSLTAPVLGSGGDTRLLIGNAATLGTVKAGGSILIDPTVVSFSALTSGGATSIVAGDVLGGTIDAGTAIAIAATGRVVLDRANAGTDLTIGGASISAPALTAGGAMQLTSSGASTLGTATAIGDFALTAASTSFSVLKSTNGAGTITAGDVKGGTIATGTTLTVNATGALAIDSASSGGAMALSANTIAAPSLTSGGAMKLTSAGLSALGTVSSGAGVQITASPLTYTSLLATGPIAINASAVTGGAITSSGGSLAITSPGAVTTGALASGTDTTIAAGALNFASLNAGGSATITASSVTGNPIVAGQDVSVASLGGLMFLSVSAGRNATLIAQAGNVTVSSDFAVGGSASVAGDGIALAAKGALSLAAVVARAGDIAVTAGGPLAVTDGQAIGNIALSAQGGALTVGRLAAGYVPTSTLGNTARSAGTLLHGPGNIALSAATGITTSGTVDSVAALTSNAGGAITINGLVTANTIALASSDLAIAATGQIGQARATAVALTDTGSGGMVLGDGFDSPGGYLVGNAEFARIHSGGNLTIDAGTAPATAAGTAARLTIGTLGASAASGTTEGNVGANGTLFLRSGNGVAVLGAATLANAGGNTLSITATGDIMIDAARGSLRLLEGTGHGGTLALGASRVLAVTPQALTDIASATSTGAITTRLSANDGTTNATLLEAGTIQASVARGFYVQNTAASTAFDDRRGLVADSLSISASGTVPITIVANGVVGGLTGLAAIPVATFPSGFDPLSTFNGCVIVAVATCNQPVGFDNPIRDVIGSVLGGPLGAELNSIQSIADGFFNRPLMAINQIAPLGFTPLIDEPVTGTGNDDLQGELGTPPLKPERKKKKARPH